MHIKVKNLVILSSTTPKCRWRFFFFFIGS